MELREGTMELEYSGGYSDYSSVNDTRTCPRTTIAEDIAKVRGMFFKKKKDSTTVPYSSLLNKTKDAYGATKETFEDYDKCMSLMINVSAREDEDLADEIYDYIELKFKK